MSSFVKNIRNLNHYYCTTDVISPVLVDFLKPQIITSYLQYYVLLIPLLSFHYLEE
jgi:hypothetical protein